MTTHRILITSLYGGVSGGKLRYYYSEKDDKISYCDALLSAEASCKYVLANHHIDEIVTFGSKSTFDEGDGLKSLLLKEGSAFYASEVKAMSTYSLFRYRLAEYLDEINVEEQDIQELLNDDEKKKVNDFVEKFFYTKENSEKTTRYNRFFDHLMQDVNLREKFINALIKEIPEAKEDSSRFLTWTYQKLYTEMKDSAKLELLETNSEVKIRFIPVVKDDEEGTFIENFTKIMNDIIAEGNNKIELYICVQSDDASDTFVLINLMNLIKAMPEADISVAKVITTTKSPEEAVAHISDDTLKFGVSDLVAGTRAFLQYGKTDMLLEFWHKSGLVNPEIDRLLYAMRNIDYGISLCDVSDILRGIKSLRDLLKDVKDFKGDTFVERYFGMIANGIKQDYGSLVESDDIIFIDLVKWAYRKGFWQQTLTLIESRAPEDIVDRGFFYYSNSPSVSQEVVKVLGQIYYDLKPYEKYKLDDISHYYVKFFGRGRVQHLDDSKEYQMAYANARMEELESADQEIQAHTLCPDKEALRDMLFSYYYIGDVRNATNHASEEFAGFSAVMHDSDVSERMNAIVKAIEYFIHCYDAVIELVEKSGKKNDVTKVEHSELVAFAKKLKPHYNNNNRNYNNGNRNYNNNGNRNFNNNGQGGNGQNYNGNRNFNNNGQNNNGNRNFNNNGQGNNGQNNNGNRNFNNNAQNNNAQGNNGQNQNNNVQNNAQSGNNQGNNVQNNNGQNQNNNAQSGNNQGNNVQNSNGQNNNGRNNG